MARSEALVQIQAEVFNLQLGCQLGGTVWLPGSIRDTCYASFVVARLNCVTTRILNAPCLIEYALQC
ncbi:hypothetical protein CMV_025758 [Castanea mollissima]|uniref:Uncharacterized protein n=1 Tax=Castanea mollissima TaxID=60419 RepID=A0A8J4VB42_9ROSI|nr:hypothetical protein CMV_025758 [Castanea mollissima]